MKSLNKEEFEKSITNSNDENNLEAKPRKCCTISVPLKEKKDKTPKPLW